MKKKIKILLPIVFFLVLIGVVCWYLSGHNVAVLSPRGEVGQKERNLMTVAILLSVIVVVPVYAMTIAIVLKYREGNKKTKKYSPEWDHSKLFEGLWWGIPFAIIFILSIITWNSSHALDPYKPLSSTTEPIHVQVVALDWKWLFIYPDRHVASVNELALPVNTPVDFDITSDTVMNSFWIPNLGSQIYAMPGMSTQLHLMASKTGSYPGSSANISGKGFAGMAFTAKVDSPAGYESWIRNAQKAHSQLDVASYEQLAKPGEVSHPTYYSSADNTLYNGVVMHYMMPGAKL